MEQTERKTVSSSWRPSESSSRSASTSLVAREMIRPEV